MNPIKFDRFNDPKPMTALRAVRRGTLCVNGLVFLIIFASTALALAAVSFSLVGAAVLWFLGLGAAWLWWSYFIPQWRAWALSRGADATELQTRAVQAQLVWAKGHFFECTEINRNGR
jgi:uncharacterized membrane protein